jgi:tetratricopeptide (TPR) repeat protein
MLVGRVTAIRAARDAGNYRLADELVRSAIDTLERECDERGPEMAVLLNELGMIGKYFGNFDEAEDAYRRALAIHSGSGDMFSANVASLLHNLAGLAHARGDAADAEPLARLGILIRSALPTPGPLAVAQDRAALAAILIDLDRLTEANEILSQTLRTYEEVYGPVHYEVAVALHNLGSLLFRQGRWAEAADTLRRALAMKTYVLGTGNPDLAITMHNLACCELELEPGETDSVRELLQRAVEILEASVAPSHPTLASCRAKLDAIDSRHRRQPCSR